jgi:hypothetical protein
VAHTTKHEYNEPKNRGLPLPNSYAVAQFIRHGTLGSFWIWVWLPKMFFWSFGRISNKMAIFLSFPSIYARSKKKKKGGRAFSAVLYAKTRNK